MTATTVPTCNGVRAQAGSDGALVAASWQGETFPVDTLVLATAREPAGMLAQMRGCPLVYDAAGGGYVPVRDATLQTPIPLLYVAGDAGGVGNAGAAMAQGRLAGHTIADRLGMPAATVPLPLSIPPGAFGPTPRTPDAGTIWMDDDTLVACRCEEVTVAAVRAAIHAGARTPGDVKRRTRVGNGPCQGRWCGHNVAQLVAALTSQPLTTLAPMTARPPVVPVSLGALADAAFPTDGDG